MPQKKNAIKSLRQSKKKAILNKAIKDKIKELKRNTRKAIDVNETEKATDLAKQMIKAIDKATQKKVIKKNTAARKKSRIIKKLNNIEKKTETKKENSII